MGSLSFANVATVTVSTKRASYTSGKRSAPAENLTGIKSTPLYPVSPEIRQRMGLDTPHTLVECFIEGDYDILTGDILVSGGVDYPIAALEKWPFNDTYRFRLILEDLGT